MMLGTEAVGERIKKELIDELIGFSFNKEEKV